MSTASQRAAVDRSRARARAFDQFYTRPDVVVSCLDLLNEHLPMDEFAWLEPSAGEGAFLKVMPEGSIGVDIDPGRDGIHIANFLEVEIVSDDRIAALGNPPFGRQASMAKRFFNYLARHEKVEVIAFILPRSFRKMRIQRELNLSFHLLCEWEVPADAFLFDGRPYDVPAVFMIWVRRAEPRIVPVAETEHPDFEFITREAAQDAVKRGEAEGLFVIQRVGNAAGRIHHDLGMSESSHLFVRPKVDDVEAIMRRLQPEFHRISRNVAGNPSIAKSEIVSSYKAFVENETGRHGDARIGRD